MSSLVNLKMNLFFTSKKTINWMNSMHLAKQHIFLIPIIYIEKLILEVFAWI